MTAHRRGRWPLALAGLLAGPMCWAIVTQAGQILPYAECRTQWPWSLPLALAGAALSAASAWLAWRGLALQRGGERRRDSAFALIASLGAMLGLLFALAMLLQALGPMVLTGCER
ncbi:hypothetical protein [Plastoroseomonas hellenica]|uniref:hypothetical protein n=1 Tax=Plastoroseomonas hellenica TaxID=2687306 RepID=UPI001BAC126D|nr:hypothetical protein [Plastoroseomonas hellenica]MBR0645406.1 hypothetical protein [Plastoroseomonas hellenica]